MENYSRVVMWVTVVWVILLSYYPRPSDAGPAAFVACVGAAAGPICAATAATSKLMIKIMYYYLLINISQMS